MEKCKNADMIYLFCIIYGNTVECRKAEDFCQLKFLSLASECVKTLLIEGNICRNV